MVYKRLFSPVNLAMPVQSVRTEPRTSYFEINVALEPLLAVYATNTVLLKCMVGSV